VRHARAPPSRNAGRRGRQRSEDLPVAKKAFNRGQVEELLYQALETEIGGVAIYEKAVAAAVNEDLRKEWTEYLAQTKKHKQVLTRVITELGLDPATMTPGRAIVKHIGESLASAIGMAIANGDREAAELVAGECVSLAETKDHMNWELIGHVAKEGKGDETTLLLEAYEEIEDEEDEHVYHSKGWTRELWIKALGFPAVLPPPEERKHVETAIGAARAEQDRKSML
jgi:rubrerythrin